MACYVRHSVLSFTKVLPESQQFPMRFNQPFLWIGLLALLGMLCSQPTWISESLAQEDDATADSAAADNEQESRSIRRIGDIQREDNEQWSPGLPTFNRPATQPVQAELASPSPDAAINAQLIEALNALAINPDDANAGASIEQAMQLLEERVVSELAAGNDTGAAAYIGTLAELDPNRPGLIAAQNQLQQFRQTGALQVRFDEALAAEQLLTPEGTSARDILAEMETASVDAEVLAGNRKQLQQALLQQSSTAANTADFELANTWLTEAAAILSDEAIGTQRDSLQQTQDNYLTQLQTSVITSIDAGEYDAAEAGILELIALGTDDATVNGLRNSLQDARLYSGLVPGQTFRDSYANGNQEGPVMMVLPAGDFLMGSSSDQQGARENESPQHRVTFARGFALSQREITVAEFEVFVVSNGYRTQAERANESSIYDVDTGRMRPARVNWRNSFDGGTADPDDPVMHVSWNDAAAYASWLSDITQRSYRLPSEAEMEYAIRAGTGTTYWWGDGSPDVDAVENVTGFNDVSTTRRRWNDGFRGYGDGYWGPAPVAQMSANRFGLFDSNGNLKEWTADCWHSNYNRAPDDGSAWINPGCESRVVRGADWSSTPNLSRSATRISARASTRGARVGIRVARDL